MRFEHSVDIAAPVERVWALTVDVESWPAITSTMTAVERLEPGPIRPGSTLRVKQPAQGSRVWTVTAVEPEARFEWRTRAFGSSMSAAHVVAAQGDGTRNTLVLDIEGPVSGLVGRLIAGQVRKALATENAGFKAAAES